MGRVTSRQKLLIFTSVILLTAILSTVFLLDFSKPSIKVTIVDSKATITIVDNKGVKETLIYFKYPNGTIIKLYKGKWDKTKTINLPYDNKQEGYYKLTVSAVDYSQNNATTTFKKLYAQPPKISNINYNTYLGKLNLTALIQEYSLLNITLLINSKPANYTLVKLSEGKYLLKALSNVNEGNILIKLTAIDKWGKSASYEKSFNYKKTSEEKVLEILSKYFSLNEAKKIVESNSWLVSVYENYPELVEKIAPYADNKLALLVLDQVDRDARVRDRVSVLSRALDLVDGIGVEPCVQVAWLIGNCSNYGFYSDSGVVKAAKFISSHLNMDWNYSRPICFSALSDAYYFFPEIFDKYPWEAYYFILQVGDTFYYYKIIDIGGKEYVWNKAILPYAKWRYGKLIKGEFTPIDVRLVNGDLAKLAKWADKKVVEAACRSLYPYNSLMDIDLSGKSDYRAFSSRNYKKALEYIVNNFEKGYFFKIYDLLMKSKKTKDLLYKVGIKPGPKPDDVWVNCGKEWKWVKEYYKIHDPAALLINGYPPALAITHVLNISEQAGPYCSKIIGAMLDRCVVVYRAPYPTCHKGFHDEPMVVGKDGKLIGFWYSLSNFLKDYDPSLNPRAEDYWRDHGPFIKVISLSGGYFPEEKLSKVLNSEG